MKHNLLKSVIISVILLLGANSVWAGDATIYVTGAHIYKDTWDQSQSEVRIGYNYNTTNSGDQWTGEKAMTRTEYTYNGYPVYSYKVSSSTDYAQIYFYHYKNNQKVSESDYGAGGWIQFTTNNNKIYLGYLDGAHRWVDLCEESTYYFLKNGKAKDWEYIYAYSWYGSINNNWPGVLMSNTGKTYNGNHIYSTKIYCTYITTIFNQGNGTNQSGDQALTNQSGKIFDYENDKWIDYTYDVTITFHGNGGTLKTQKATILYMAKQLSQEIVPPTRKGYTFDGWGNSGGNTKAIDAKGNLLPNAHYSSLIYTDSQGRWIDPDGCMLYAQWLANQYLIKFDENGGTFTANGTKQIYATYEKTVPNIGNGPDDIPWRRGYAFNGYTQNADGTGSLYYNENGIGQIIFKQTKEVTVYAQWALETYTIAYELNGGTNHANNPNTYTYEDATITLQEPTKTGYTFNGWYDNSSFTGTPITQISKGSYGNKTLYAKWTANTYTVTLDQQSGTGGTTSVTATYGAAMPAITKPTRNGYTFGGYYTAINGDGTQYYNANGESSKAWNIANNTTLYAKWTANNYTITYNTNGGNSIAQKTYTIETATFDLPTPTRTGYTFAGWYDNANLTGNKVTQVAKGSTGNKTFYAAWTINQYTLTYSAGEGGSVTGTYESGAKLDYNTSVTLTATPTTGNVFAQWVNENGTTVSTDNPYTFNLTANKTVKAEFAPPTTVYLKPLDFWPSDNARFAIYTWAMGKEDRWVEMQPVDCEKQYYSANIPTGYSDFKYVRLDPAGKGKASQNDGLHWDYKWNETGNLTVQKDLLYITPRIYIKPNANWKQADARFAAYFYQGEEEKWMSMYKEGDYYYCNAVNGYSNVIFCRMNPSSETNNWENCWNKSADQKIAGNCFTVTAGEWGDNPNDQNYNEAGAKGTWSEHYTTFSTPTYNVTIKPTIHGTYSVVCNGRTYLAPNKEEIVIPNVPVGTTLTIQDVQPNNETEYTSDIIYKESANAEYQKLEGNQITVCGNTTIDENFVTRNPHVVYFRVPTSLATSWNANGTTTNFVYSYNDIKIGKTGYVTTMAADNSIQDAQYTYYCCTIPADCHTFRFERKNNANESAQQKTVSFTHAMPFNGMNCFTITNSGDEYTGYWDVLLTNGDYRLLYVEQVVEKSNASGNEWKTVVTRKKAHPSDIIKKGTPSQIVSLHIYKERTYMANAGGSEYKSSNNPEIILQQYNSSTKTWENKERHMVFGPLQTLPGMAMAPGRRNTAAETPVLVYDDGIEAIKNDQHPDESNGVWNFTVTQTNNGESATIDLTKTERYDEVKDGPYYIRTDVANGNWYNYTNPDNHMTRSDVSKQHSNYSHYFCKWVESTGNVNVKFTIANKYGYAISDTLEADRTDLWGVELTEAQKMLKDQTLPEDANVRFTWNEKSNLIHRAYIAGSANVQDRFLVLRGKGDSKLFSAAGEALTEGQEQTPRYGLHANEEIFSDIENWVYKTDVQMIPGAELQITADYNKQVQYFVGKEGVFNNTILQGSNNGKYLIRLLYDFKTNELISAYVPGASKDVDKISTNLMIIRQNYGEAKQLVFNNGDMSTRDNRKAYGVIEFTEDYLKDESVKYLKRCLYWVSFPFDVNLSEVFGSLVYGKHWLIQEYDGARRAAEGLWKESESFWKLHWEPNITLKAGLGYVIEIDINQMIKDNIIDLTDAKQQIAALYFPSSTPITNAIINRETYTVNIPAHKCEIVHTGTYGDRTIRDSHWNVIGVPSYVNTGATFSDQRFALNNVVKYYYQWEGEVDKYIAMEANKQAYSFHSMYAYMVQYAGDITWNSVLLDVVEPAQIAAKKNSATNEHAMRLELQQNNILLDKTFVRLQDDVATPAFDFNYDLCKITNKGANIYSIITAEASPVDVAANVLPIEETIIPIGIKTDAAGEYTFAMPDGTDGIVVELIDYENNTRTNMLLDNYTVNLGKGTFESRFALHVKPDKTTTSVDNIGNEATGDKVKKYLIDGILYMQKDGFLYDAQGKLVR